MKKTREELFWSRVTVGDGCWIHSGSLGSHGYPQATSIYSTTPHSTTAHRVALQIAEGRRLLRSEFGLHKCANKACVRVHPEHVVLGSHVENMRDMSEAGHSTTRKLSDDDVRWARTCGLPQGKIAERLGVSTKTAVAVIRRRTYKEVV